MDNVQVGFKIRVYKRIWKKCDFRGQHTFLNGYRIPSDRGYIETLRRQNVFVLFLPNIFNSFISQNSEKLMWKFHATPNISKMHMKITFILVCEVYFKKKKTHKCMDNCALLRQCLKNSISL